MLIENDTLRIYAHGETIEEAAADYASQLKHFSSYYKGLREDQLTRKGRELKRLFASVRPSRHAEVKLMNNVPRGTAESVL